MNCTFLRDYNKYAYKWRHLIKNFFAKIKEFRAKASRYEKTASSYAANWHLAVAIIASRLMSADPNLDINPY